MKRDDKKMGQKGMAGHKTAVSPVEIQKYLKGISYPATRQEVIDTANQNNAPMEIVELVQNVPDKSFSSPADLTKEIGRM